jgi:hypothetical protein
MTDERTLLEQRVAWLEREMVRLLWAPLGIAIAAWGIAGWYLQRHEFRGAPAHVKLMDP